ncbi:MAG: hypothetical protein JWN02_1431 [Acidobacteria bacterium]|nr:hypothetical protein [Acidobacteriota bacterium]
MSAVGTNLGSRFGALTGGTPHSAPAADVIELACPNCGLGPVAAYCAACGQRRITEHDLTFAGFMRDTVHEFTSLDGRLWATLATLLLHPGLLAREYFAGRGSRYMKPLSLFVLLNLVFFIIQPHTGLMAYSYNNYTSYDGDVAAKRQDAANAVRIDQAMSREARRVARKLPPQAPVVGSPEVFRAHFDDTLQDLKKSMLLVSIPVFALTMLLLYATTGRRYAEHLVFSVHVYAFFLVFAGVVVTPLFMGVLSALRAIGVSEANLEYLSTEAALIAVLFVVIGGYIFLGLRRMYGDGRLIAALRACALFIVMEILIAVYHDVLFYATLASL